MNIRKQLRKEEAAKRQAAYDALSIAERIKRVKARRGESKRELARLMKLAEEAA